MIIINKEKSEYNKIQLRNSELTKRNYRKSSIKPPGGGAYFKHIGGWGGGGLFERRPYLIYQRRWYQSSIKN